MLKTIPKPFPSSYPPSQDLLPPKTVFYCDMQDRGNKGIDHSGYNNHVTWSSGVINKAGHCGNRKSVVTGNNAFGSIVNSPSIDISSAPLTFLTVIKPSAGGYIFAKNVDAANNIQYGVNLNTTSGVNRIDIYLEGAVRSSSANGSIDITGNLSQLVGFVWDGSTVQAVVQGLASGSAGSYSGTLTSRANTRIGCRGNNSGFITASLGEMWIIRKALSFKDIKNLSDEIMWKYGVKI